ncbi:hypothetical protein JKP88DRAFT_279880 [Tribonema minus]|uniref:Glutathione S-transferase n=1 Tax=Tribonema minus TaxID=303371 RepID=A0A835YRP1_9STRA|nr:hypothetical protein JKP88DRAFT_279880 [Tribonema minus]
MTPKYTLHYFNFTGRAEPVRLALAICGVPFTDKRITRDELMAGKASGFLPYGTVPILEVEMEDGKKDVIAETAAIMAYIVAAHGAAAGMARTDPLDIARVEEIRSAADGMFARIAATMSEKDEAKKMAVRAELAATVIPRKLAVRAELAITVIPKTLAAIDARLRPDGHVCGDTLTSADLILDGIVAWLALGVLDGIPTTLVAPYANVERCRANVRAHPRVREWYASKQA